MRRLHLFEFEDLAWFPRLLRDGGTAYLELMARIGDHAARLGPTVKRGLTNTNPPRIVDLCSGGGGPIAGVVDALVREGHPVQAVLTDLYPNTTRFARVAKASGGHIAFSGVPIDATQVPPDLRGLRTLFNAFHHFRPDMARKVLADAMSAREPIAVFEVVGRHPALLAGMLLAPLMVALAVPLLRPFRWAWLPLTYVLPVLPLFVLWDGIVSCLRVYSDAELRALVCAADPRSAYTWEIGRIAMGPPGVHASYLLGLPDGTPSYDSIA